mmetsp:Transcript_58481/g.163905  ORF Transcript_58481/g.163905 Transcript_58481/m.163905 type:complete len:242 (-) Transcript_58481:321-1046(-)
MADHNTPASALEESLNLTTDEELALGEVPAKPSGLRKAGLAGVGVLLLAAGVVLVVVHGGARAASAPVFPEALLAAYSYNQGQWACSGCHCDCGWAQKPGACNADGHDTTTCCFSCCCGGSQFPRLSYDAIYNRGDQFHGALPVPASASEPCKYTTGSEVLVRGADGGWHHAVVTQMLAGCQYEVEVTAPRQQLYSSELPHAAWCADWWGADWWCWCVNWWWVFLVLLAVLLGLHVATAKR